MNIVTQKDLDQSSVISPIKHFLQHAKTSVQCLDGLESCKRVKIVLGNMSCDLDSAACTLAYALLLHSENANVNNIVLPVFNVTAEEIVLKTEVVHLLKKFNLPLDLLIFRNEISNNLLKLGANQQLDVILVDHHFDEEFKNMVVEIIDHRPIEYDLPKTASITIQPVGSCATLVMQKIIGRCKSILAQFPELVELVYGAILLDTNNMSTVTQRFTECDLNILNQIEPLVLCKNEGMSRKGYFDMMMAVRCDVSALTPLQMLYKDSKKVYTLPVCGLTMLVQNYCTLDGIETALKTYCAANTTSEIIIMGLLIQDGIVSRDIAFYSNTSDVHLMTRIAESLIASPENGLCLEVVADKSFKVPGLTVYKQKNNTMTRKHVLPLIKSILDCSGIK